jgi:uncharacterized protein YgbK (DUF1537 family)
VFVVVADDITGAAEIAGVGLRYGLSVALDTVVTAKPSPSVDLWVVALNTRSMNGTEAVNSITATLKALLNMGFTDVFKKTDSVLRGHVVAELAAKRNILCKRRVLLSPANPEGGRIIKNGIYYINGVPLDETGFSKDPEFPAKTSSVKDLLGKDTLEQESISIANAENADNLLSIVQGASKDTILAGSAAFFDAYLKSESLCKKSWAHTVFIKKALYICGSAFLKSHEAVEEVVKKGAGVVYISPLWLGDVHLLENLEKCTARLTNALNEGSAVLAVDLPTLGGKEAAMKLRNVVAQVAAKVLDKTNVDELVIEGGASAFAVIEKLKVNRFLPVNEYAPGVVRMKVVDRPNMHLTIKPGSYDWVKELWPF